MNTSCLFLGKVFMIFTYPLHNIVFRAMRSRKRSLAARVKDQRHDVFSIKEPQCFLGTPKTSQLECFPPHISDPRDSHVS